MKNAQITDLLNEWDTGNQDAFGQLVSAVYRDLYHMSQKMVAKHFHKGRDACTLNPTALVHETYVLLEKQRGPSDGWQNRNHFFAVAKRLMLYAVLNFKRADMRHNPKPPPLVEVDDHLSNPDWLQVTMSSLDEALKRLSEVDSTAHQLIRAKFFEEVPVTQLAEKGGCHINTIYRRINTGLAFLRVQLSDRKVP